MKTQNENDTYTVSNRAERIRKTILNMLEDAATTPASYAEMTFLGHGFLAMSDEEILKFEEGAQDRQWLPNDMEQLKPATMEDRAESPF